MHKDVNVFFKYFGILGSKFSLKSNPSDLFYKFK